MKRLFLLTILTLSLNITATAQQTGSISGVVIDESSRIFLPGAVVEVSPSTGGSSKHIATGDKGNFVVSRLPYGAYNVKITFMGYITYEKNVALNRQVVNVGTVSLKKDIKQLAAVSVQGTMIRTSQQGDTVSYNADAFKVTQDADLEGLITKMPGITVENGAVTAQGEEVKKIFVNGKEFFGEDVATAIKNIPSEMASKIEIINKLSDRAEMTGVDDGEGFKAINIVTNEGMSTGQFGKLYAGYGTNDRYTAGGNVNIFTASGAKISLIGMINNINQQNFSTDDILGVMGSGGTRGGRGGRRGAGNFMISQADGISRVASFGTNYTDTWGEKINVNASYFFNNMHNENTRFTDRAWNEEPLITQTDENSNRSNYNHRFNGRFDYKINDRNTITFRPNLSFQDNKSDSFSQEFNMEHLMSDTTGLNRKNNFATSDANGYNLSGNLLYALKFTKPGRSITIDLSGGKSKSDSYNYNDFERYNFILQPPKIDSIDRNKVNNLSSGYNLGGNVTYTEPLSEKSNLNLQYNISYRYSDADKQTWQIDQTTEELLFNPERSNIYNSGYLTHRMGPGYRFTDKQMQFVANVYFQTARLASNREYPLARDMNKTFNNVLYFAMLNKTFNPTNTLRIFLRSTTRNPSITDLQDVVTISGIGSSYTGNPSLAPTYSHSFSFNYNRSDTNKGRSFMLSGRVGIDQHYIADSTGISIVGGDVSRISKPVNMDGSWSARLMASLGIPLGFIRSNLNLSAGVDYGQTPSINNQEKNLLRGTSYTLGAMLGSNISEKIDFTIGYNNGLSLTRNTAGVGNSKENKFFNQSAAAKIKWVTWKGFTLTANGIFTQYNDITESTTTEYLLCNVFVGKKIFRNQRGEFQIGFTDVFNQNKSFVRNSTPQYFENVTNMVLPRYVMFQFTYNLRNFGKRNTSRSEPGVSNGGSNRPAAPGGRPEMMGPAGPGRGFGPGM